MTPGSVNGDLAGDIDNQNLSIATSKTKQVLDTANLKQHNKNSKKND